jgi:hypothetical protein
VRLDDSHAATVSSFDVIWNILYKLYYRYSSFYLRDNPTLKITNVLCIEAIISLYSFLRIYSAPDLFRWAQGLIAKSRTKQVDCPLEWVELFIWKDLARRHSSQFLYKKTKWEIQWDPCRNCPHYGNRISSILLLFTVAPFSIWRDASEYTVSYSWKHSNLYLVNYSCYASVHHSTA